MNQQPPENNQDDIAAEKPDTDQPVEPSLPPVPPLQKPRPRSTTFDVAKDAEEARRMYETRQQNEMREHEATLNAGQPINWEDMMLRVEVQGGGTPLLLPLVGDTVIGRRDPSTQTSPELDLTPYGAYQMGISRRHAIIRVKDDVPTLTDLGSRNGTYINGKKLKAHQSVPLKDGDEVRLGKIVMQIFFQSTEDDDATDE